MNFLKSTVLLGLMLALTNISVAQSYSITPNDTAEISGMKEDLLSLMISQLNTSNDTIRLKWQKVSEVVPANWDATICDNAICYGNLVDSGRMTSTAPGATSFLLLHVTAHVNSGTAIVRYAVWNPVVGTHRDTLTFIVNASATTGISEADRFSDMRMYPNPVTDVLQVTTDREAGFEIRVTDISGKQVRVSKTSSSSLSVSTKDLPAGFYYVTLWDNNTTISTHKIIKE
ncbi:MAG: T9SS type A sorting domain-containing protein [Bacteroidetes bacterium]|nr:T9SS type A sorting domain-containing protein [Bacteroidota bacterium]